MEEEMSGHADTIRDAVDAERARLVPGTVEKYPAAKVSVRILDADALLAENQRLRDLLQRLSEWDALNIDPPEWPWGDWPQRWKAEVDEALAGDGE
jgi:hypothetical protein